MPISREWLSVQIANHIGADVFNDCTILLDVELGPALDGVMTLWELCQYTGITINGKTINKPNKDIDPKHLKLKMLSYVDYADMMKRMDYVVPSEDDTETKNDLSGETSFFNAHLESTIITARALVDGIVSHFGNVVILQWDEIEKYKTYIPKIIKTSADITQLDFHLLIGDAVEAVESIEGEGAMKWGDDVSIALPNHLVINVGFSGFAYELRSYGNKDSERVKKELDIEAYFAGQDLKCLFAPLSVNAKIVTNGDVKKARLVELNEILNEFYPASNLCKVDIKTGEIIERDYRIKPLDPIITNWLNASDAHWLNICDWENLVGIKPIT